MIEQLTESLAGQKDTITAYYFFECAQKESLSSFNFLRSILHQMIRTESLNPALQRRLEAILVGPNDSRKPEMDKLETLIIELCGKLKNVIVLVDGVNEAEPEDQSLVLHFLKKAVQKSRAVIKLFISTRPEVDVRSFFRGDGQLMQINIRAQDTQIEIDKVINSRVEKQSREGSLVVREPAMIDKIKKTLKIKAGGRYNTHLKNLVQLSDK